MSYIKITQFRLYVMYITLILSYITICLYKSNILDGTLSNIFIAIVFYSIIVSIQIWYDRRILNSKGQSQWTITFSKRTNKTLELAQSNLNMDRDSSITFAFKLLSLYLEAKENNSELAVIDKNGDVTEIEIICND